MTSIVAIDPGATHTGIVHMDSRRIIDARTIHCKGGCGTDNEKLAQRARLIWDQVEAFIIEHPHDVVVIEGYQRYPGIRVAAGTMHQTPWLCGVLVDRIISRGEPYAIQMSGDVLRGRANGSMLQIYEELNCRTNRFIYEGQEKLTNEHLRSAFCHGLYYMRRAEG